MSKNIKTDRRVRRTITNLQKALKQLMAQKPYAKIKVSEIVVLADVADTIRSADVTGEVTLAAASTSSLFLHDVFSNNKHRTTKTYFIIKPLLLYPIQLLGY